jgi:hypothetical protein
MLRCTPSPYLPWFSVCDCFFLPAAFRGTLITPGHRIGAILLRDRRTEVFGGMSVMSEEDIYA